MNTPPVEFHNVPAPETWEMGAGLLLPRYPKHLRHGHDYERGRVVSGESTGVEIRFVTKASILRVFLSGVSGDADICIYRGSMEHGRKNLQEGRVHCLHLEAPPAFDWVDLEALQAGGFHSDVWRLIVDQGSVVFHGIETFGQEVRPPRAEEKPWLRWLAYGSSITQARCTGYPHQAARRLGVDVLNKGMSGSCSVDAASADFLARDCDWDFATFELGVNMRGFFSPEDFEKRARHLVVCCQEAKPGRPIVLITVFPNFADFRVQPGLDTRRDSEYSRILREIAGEYSGQGVHLLEGSSLLKDFSALGTDLLHPSDFGHGMMGENLANELRRIVPGLSKL